MNTAGISDERTGNVGKKRGLKGFNREFYVLFLDSLPSRVNCKLVCLFHKACNVLFCLSNESDCGITADTFCSTLLGNPNHCCNW